MATVIQMGAEIEQRGPTGGLIQKLRHDDYVRDQIAAVLPQTVGIDRFTRAAMTALVQNPDLAKADETSLFQSLVKCASDGLLPDGREAALVLYRTKMKTERGEQWVDKAQYIPMIGGVRKIAAEFGWTIRTHVVYQNDQFEHEQGTDDRIMHRPAPPGADRGPLVAAYAVAHHRDGRRSIVEVMRAEDIAKAKAVSKSDKVWDAWPAQMWEKTVGHRIAKKLALDPQDVQRLARVIEAAEVGATGAAEALYGPAAGASFTELEGVQPTPNPSAGEAVTAPPVRDVPSNGGGQADTGSEGDPGIPPAATTPLDDEAVMFAAAAAEYVPPVGKYAASGEAGPLSLSEILDLGDDGRVYLFTVMRKTPNEELLANALAFGRVQMPEEYAQAVAERAAQAEKNQAA